MIPVRNEVEHLARTIDSCLAQDYDGPIEIVVADAMSTDGTRDVIARYTSQLNGKVIEGGRTRRVVAVDNHARSTPAGLNLAIAATDSEVIVRCDGHAVLPEGYVSEAVSTLASTSAGNVGGVQRARGTSPIQRGIARAMTNPLGVGDARFHRGGTAGPTDTVYLGVFRRDALEAVGAFDESLERNQDYELNVRLRAAGWQVWFQPTLEVDYTPRSGLGGLWRQYYAYGAWKRKVLRMHPGSLKARQAAPPVLVVGLVASTALLATPLRPIGGAAIVGYIAALGAAAGYEAVVTRDPASLLAAPAIGTMHIAWGTGFLIGRR